MVLITTIVAAQIPSNSIRESAWICLFVKGYIRLLIVYWRRHASTRLDKAMPMTIDLQQSEFIN